MVQWCYIVGVISLSICICRGQNSAEQVIEKEFTENTNYCKDSVENVHANSAPTTRLNHFLLCLAQKTETEVRLGPTDFLP